jgi:hypothetical protein
MDLVTVVVVLFLLMALISAIVVLSAVVLGGRARQFEDDPDGEPMYDEPDVRSKNEPVDQ